MDIPLGPNCEHLFGLPVQVTGNNPVEPCTSIHNLRVCAPIPYALQQRGFTLLTPVQKYAIPAILAKRDVLACSPTGSGKTDAFMVPIVDDLLRNPEVALVNKSSETCYPQVFVITPTRELALQIVKICEKLIEGTVIVVVPLIGGIKRQRQVDKLLEKGAHIIVATPGRFDDLLEEKHINLSKIRFAVLDEADRMLDMGFGRKVRNIMAHDTMVNIGDRQTLMFSATYPRAVAMLANGILNDYLFIVAGEVNAPNRDIDELFIKVDSEVKKREKLLQLLREFKELNGEVQTLIFVNTRRKCMELSNFLNDHLIDCEFIRGDMHQTDREAVLTEFREKQFPVLVATDVMARGINVMGLDHVINYDLPKHISIYVNRIGRTGRLGNPGMSTSFFQPGREEDEKIGPELVWCLAYCQKEVPTFLQHYNIGSREAHAAARNVNRRRRRNIVDDLANLTL